jgi:hypothetical protein
LRSLGYGALCLLLGELLVGNVQASAHIWPVDMPPEKFSSFNACLAVLEQQDRDDRQDLNSSPKHLDNGAIVETNLQGPGLRRTGKESAEYQATVGWRTRMKVGDHMEANYTYETRELRCVKSTLHSRPSGGAEPAMPE